jgi:hypothetical protein
MEFSYHPFYLHTELKTMHCPVYGCDCVNEARELFRILPGQCAPRPDCMGIVYDKRVPPLDIGIIKPCVCRKQFIDEVVAHISRIVADVGDLTGTEPVPRAKTLPCIEEPFTGIHLNSSYPPGGTAGMEDWKVDTFV